MVKYFHDIYCQWWNMVHKENVYDKLCPKDVDNAKSTLCFNIHVHWLFLHEQLQKQALTKSSGVIDLRRVLITRKALKNSKHIETAQNVYILSYGTCSNIYGVGKKSPIYILTVMVYLKRYHYSTFHMFHIFFKKCHE